MGLEERAEDRDIDGTNYRAWPIGSKVGLQALERALHIVGPVVSAIFREDTDGKRIAALMEQLTQRLTAKDLSYFGKVFGDAAQYVDAATGNMVPLIEATQDIHFAGRYDAFLAWILFAMEVNGFMRFFTGALLRSAVANIQAKMPTASK